MKWWKGHKKLKYMVRNSLLAMLNQQLGLYLSFVHSLNSQLQPITAAEVEQQRKPVPRL
uniref:Uncharacterized protein n=1 Tax=Rhizophora mucronata TaxID=61149 RepID=A0A2P2QDH8_RHIMU